MAWATSRPAPQVIRLRAAIVVSVGQLRPVRIRDTRVFPPAPAAAQQSTQEPVFFLQSTGAELPIRFVECLGLVERLPVDNRGNRDRDPVFLGSCQDMINCVPCR